MFTCPSIETVIDRANSACEEAGRTLLRLPHRLADATWNGFTIFSNALKHTDNDYILRVLFCIPLLGEYTQALQIEHYNDALRNVATDEVEENKLLNRKVRVLELAMQSSVVKLVASVALMHLGFIIIFGAETAVNAFLLWDQNRFNTQHLSLSPNRFAFNEARMANA